jgi:peptide/nickel transport system substrate-binding protein
MDEAGYKDGFSITIDAPDSEGYSKLINKIAEQLKEINITVIPHLLPGQEYLTKIFLKNTSMYLAGFSPLSSEGTIRLLLHTSIMNEGYGIWNYGNYSNSEVDGLHTLMRVEMDSTIRNKYIQDAFMIAMNDVAWIPLYSSKAFYVVKDTISWTPRHSSYILVDEISIKN